MESRRLDVSIEPFVEYNGMKEIRLQVEARRWLSHLRTLSDQSLPCESIKEGRWRRNPHMLPDFSLETTEHFLERLLSRRSNLIFSRLKRESMFSI